MEVDADRLVVSVQERAALYNYTLKDHHDKRLTNKLWDEVAKEVNSTAGECRIKWHNLKKSYARHQRNAKKHPGRSGSFKKKKWHLADTMSFLDPFVVQNRPVTGNMDFQTENASTGPEFDDDQISTGSETFSNNDANCQMSLHENISAELLAEPMVEFLKSRISLPRSEPECAMLLFFKSMLADTEKLTPRRQRSFKDQVSKCLNQLMDEQEDEDLLTSSRQHVNH